MAKFWRVVLLGLFAVSITVGCGGPGPASDGTEQESTIGEPVPEDAPPADPGNPTEEELAGEQPPG